MRSIRFFWFSMFVKVGFNKVKGFDRVFWIIVVFIGLFFLSSTEVKAQCSGTYWCQAYDSVYGICSSEQATQRFCQGSTAAECYASAGSCVGGCATLANDCLWNGVGGGNSQICMPEEVTEEEGCYPTSPACCEVPNGDPCITIRDHSCAVRAVHESGYGWCLCIPDGPWLTPIPTPTPGSVENECLGTVDGKRIGCLSACARDGFEVAGKHEYCEQNEPGTICCLLETQCSNLGIKYACLNHILCAPSLVNSVGSCDDYGSVCCNAFEYEKGQNCDYSDLTTCTLEGGYYNCQWSDSCAGSEGVWSCCHDPEKQYDSFGQNSDIPIGCSFSFSTMTPDGDPKPNGNCSSLVVAIDLSTVAFGEVVGIGDGGAGAGDEWRVVDLEGSVLTSGTGDAARFNFSSILGTTYVLQFQMLDGGWMSSAVVIGDLDGDRDVDIFDYNQLLSDFGKTGGNGFIPADIDNDGDVDIFDYNAMIGNFGRVSG